MVGDNQTTLHLTTEWGDIRKGHSVVQRAALYLCKIYVVYGRKAEQPASTACLLADKRDNMRNAICARTQTSKAPTRMALVYTPYSETWLWRWLPLRRSKRQSLLPTPQNKEIYRRATQWCNVSPFFYANIMQYLARRRSSQPVQRVYWPFCWLTCIYLAGVMADSMRNAICVATQTSKLPTRVALLYISLFCANTNSP